jgi:N-methylhydantoinase A/oxoprolinase/acetone carboxylase beta subunit
MTAARARVGINVGETFTDLVLVDDATGGGTAVALRGGALHPVPRQNQVRGLSG